MHVERKSLKLCEHLKKNMKYFGMFKKNIAWILQQVRKIQKDFDLYFKNI